ncbi:ABC transporter substrate-binding protein [Arthrobacter sp. KN11-1C]|uniref:ABC transporter substrate-binding protein n=1 Tax=Arthrobacter sp. KN11-1C TaxID=3445774 RepID=UPI003FA05EB0
MKKSTKIVLMCTGFAMVLTGCSPTQTVNSGTSSGSAGMISQLNFGDFGGGSNPQVNFNPFSPNKLSGTNLIFESLMTTNHANCDSVPDLATKMTWSQDSKTLTFDIRDNVKWSDGKAFTADDAAFTFNLMKKYPAIDSFGLWKVLTGVKATGNTLVMSFNTSGIPFQQQITEQMIVPQHIFETAGDPKTFVNGTAIGTGPYVLGTFNPRQLTMKRNADYWQADKVKVEQIQYTKADGGGQVDQLKLANGGYDTNAMFIPQVEQAYVQKDPAHNKYWFPAGSSITLDMNLTKQPFNDVNFRKAISGGIDRKAMIDKAELGYVTQASQTGLKLPIQDSWLDPSVADKGMVAFDASKADAALTAAGYTKDSSGTRLGLDGKPLTMSFKVPQGWNDWVQAAGLLQNDMKNLGISVDVQTPAPSVVEDARATGNYDMVFGVQGGECNMYRNFAFPLGSSFSAPVGQKASSNFARWQDPQTDKLLGELAAAPDTDSQHKIVSQIQQIMVNQVPMIPLWYGAVWFEYRTANAVGWPSKDDPYAYPGDQLLWLTHLTPAK